MSSPSESLDGEKSPEEYYSAQILELTDPHRLFSAESPDEEVISISEDPTPHLPVASTPDPLQFPRQQTWAEAKPMDFTTTKHRPVASEEYIRRINQTLLGGTVKLQRQQSEWMRLHCTCGILQGPFRFPDSMHPLTVPLPNYIINNADDNRFVMHYTNAVEQTVANWVDSLQHYLYPATTCHCTYHAQSERSLMSSLHRESHLDLTSQLLGSSSGRLHAPDGVVQSPNAGDSVGGQQKSVMASPPNASLHSDQAHRRDDVSILHATHDSHSTTTVPLALQQGTSYHEKTAMRPVQPSKADPAEYALLPSPRQKTGDATEISVTPHGLFFSSNSWGACRDNPPVSYPDPPGWYRDPPVNFGIKPAMRRSNPPPITITSCLNKNRYDDVVSEVGNKLSTSSLASGGGDGDKLTAVIISKGLSNTEMHHPFKAGAAVLDMEVKGFDDFYPSLPRESLPKVSQDFYTTPLWSDDETRISDLLLLLSDSPFAAAGA